MERHNTDDLGRSTKHIRSGIEQSAFFRGLLKTIGVLAVSMVMADGVLTPAQSVLGAVQGLNVVKPDIDKSTIVGVTCAILISFGNITGGIESLAVSLGCILFIELSAFFHRGWGWLGLNFCFKRSVHEG